MRVLPVVTLVACSSVHEPFHASADLPAPPKVAKAPTVEKFETFSPITQAPSVPRSDVAGLNRYLEVRTSGADQEIVFQPEGRITWRVVRGPHGIVEKRTFVDGELWTKTHFDYDAAGHVAKKHVDLAGGATIDESYVTDALGRTLERRRSDDSELWKVTYGANIEAETTIDKVRVRRDVFDAAGRILETHVGRPIGKSELVLTYARDAEGKIASITRTTLGGKPRPATLARDKEIIPLDLGFVPPILERHEVQLLLGTPVTHSVTGKGAARKVVDRYSDGCWLNQPSAIEYDAADLAHEKRVECICGFCVDAASLPSAEDVLGSDEHITAGPWIRIDGHLDVTADHALLTPEGPRAAGSLVAGDVVLADDGTPRPLLAVERLPPGPPRLGVNLRTKSGVFFAGGLSLASEEPRACE